MRIIIGRLCADPHNPANITSASNASQQPEGRVATEGGQQREAPAAAEGGPRRER
jgi:hypothetical protein